MAVANTLAFDTGKIFYKTFETSSHYDEITASYNLCQVKKSILTDQNLLSYQV
jgi:hypothetical protein